MTRPRVSPVFEAAMQMGSRPGAVRPPWGVRPSSSWNDRPTAELVDDAINALSRSGPTLGRPLVDAIAHSTITNLKELRPGSRGGSEIRLFVFDPWRSAILLVAGDKARQWNRWYERAIPHAEHLYEVYLKERGEEEAER